MAPPVVERCYRCATKIRNHRKLCPCCGLDLNAPIEHAGDAAASGEQPHAASSSQGIKKVSAKAGVRMCLICTQSVQEDQMVEQDGQKICPECAEIMKKKVSKKVAPAPDKK
jgi:hypothetical protein